MQIQEIILIFSLVFIIQLPILIVVNYLRKNKILKNAHIIGTVAYFAVIVNLTLWPPLWNQPSIEWTQIPYNIVPFKSIIGSLNHSYYMVGIRNVFGNFVLLLPLAFVLNMKGWKSVTLYGLFISLSIEIAQVMLTKTGWILSRSFDIDDIILNSLGFYFGYMMRVVVTRLLINKGFMKVTRSHSK